MPLVFYAVCWRPGGQNPIKDRLTNSFKLLMQNGSFFLLSMLREHYIFWIPAYQTVEQYYMRKFYLHRFVNYIAR